MRAGRTCSNPKHHAKANEDRRHAAPGAGHGTSPRAKPSILEQKTSKGKLKGQNAREAAKNLVCSEMHCRLQVGRLVSANQHSSASESSAYAWGCPVNSIAAGGERGRRLGVPQSTFIA
jgi:hypothetical protein